MRKKLTYSFILLMILSAVSTRLHAQGFGEEGDPGGDLPPVYVYPPPPPPPPPPIVEPDPPPIPTPPTDPCASNPCACGASCGSSGGTTGTTPPPATGTPLNATGQMNKVNQIAALHSNITLVVAQIVYSGTKINSLTVSFSGVHGAIAQVGVMIQSVSQGVTTYNQIYSDSYTNPDTGITYTQNIEVYGNLYNGQFTVAGMYLLP